MMYIGFAESSESFLKFLGILCNLTKYLSEQKKKKLTCTEVWEALLKKLPATDAWSKDLGKLADCIYSNSNNHPTFGLKQDEYAKQLVKILHEEITPF